MPIYEYQGLLLAVLVIWSATTQSSEHSRNASANSPAKSSSNSQRAIGALSAVGLTFAGLSLAGIVAACQVAFKPKAVYRDGESQQNLAVIDPHNAPLVGSPDAQYVVNLLFDYKCPHCQQLHLMLDEVIHHYAGKLAFALCPTPLNTRCNPYIPREVDEFKDSCELARVGLAVWVADHDAFAEFDRWMFSFESGERWRPRSLDSATAKAVQLVGKQKFDAALADPWVERYLQICIQVYGDSTKSGNNAVPKLMYGSRWVVPRPYDVNDLLLILHDSLAIPAP